MSHAISSHQDALASQGPAAPAPRSDNTAPAPRSDVTAPQPRPGITAPGVPSPPTPALPGPLTSENPPSLRPSVPPSAAQPPSPAGKPPSLPPSFASIPAPFQFFKRWRLWRYEQAPDGQWQRAAYSAGGGRAIYNDYRSSAPFFAVQAVYERPRNGPNPFDGICFALGEGIAAIELNNVLVDPDVSQNPDAPDATSNRPAPGLPPIIPSSHHPLITSEKVPPSCEAPSVPRVALPWAKKLVAELATYTEITPDGRGLALIISGAVPPQFTGPDVEPIPHPEGGTFAAYHRSRTVYITGQVWPTDAYYSVEDRSARLQQIISQLHGDYKLETLFPAAPLPRAPANRGEGPEVRGVPSAADPSSPDYIPTMQEIRARWDAAQPKPKPEAHEDRSRWMTFAQIAAMEADTKRKHRLRRDPEQGPPPASDELVELAFKRFRLGRTPSGEPFAVEKAGPNLVHLFRGGADPLLATIIRRARRELGRAPRPTAARAALALLHAEALDAPKEPVHLRVASLPLAPVNRGEGPGVRGAIAAPTPPSPLASANPPLSKKKRRRLRNLKNSKALPRPSASPTPKPSGPAGCTFVGGAAAIARPSVVPNPHPSEQIVIDLGTPDGRAVVVTAEGWQVVDRSPVLFRRTALTGEMPIPERGGSLELLRSLVNVSDESWPLLRGWLIAAFFPSIAHPVLLLGGLQDAGKSTALRIFANLIDPSPAPLRTEPRDTEHWSVMAHNSWCLPLDNISSIPPWFSDALCKAVTGDGYVRRKANTDGDVTLFEFRRVMALSSIDPGALRGDLADRLLLVELDSIDGRRRRPDSRLLSDFESLKPLIFGALLDELSTVLRLLPQVHLEQLPRMADFAQILAALDQASDEDAKPAEDANEDANDPFEDAKSTLQDAKNAKDAKSLAIHFTRHHPSVCWPSHPSPLNTTKPSTDRLYSSLAMYLHQIQHLAEEVIEADGLGSLIAEFVESSGAWEGTATELLSLVTKQAGRSVAELPKTPRAFSCRLRRLAPALNSIGVAIDFHRLRGLQRRRLIRLSSANQTPQSTATPTPATDQHSDHPENIANPLPSAVYAPHTPNK